MNLFAFGLNHKTTPLALREQLSMPAAELGQRLQSLGTALNLDNLVILSTCNRTEFYTNHGSEESFKQALHACLRLPLDPFKTSWYSYQHEHALAHLLRVAIGLDSMVLGEPQIFGQMKEAYRHAELAGTINHHFNHLFQYVFSTAKHVRTQTQIGAHPISLAYMGLTLAKRIFSPLSECKLLLIGAGEMMELAAQHFKSAGIDKIGIVNRNLARAEALAATCQGMALPLSELPHSLAEADIVISATRSTLPIVGKGMVEKALKFRKHRPMLMLDLAVPRDIEPEIADLSDIYLYNIDDLHALVNESLKERKIAASEAEKLIQLHVEYYLQKIKGLTASDVIRRYRESIELMRQRELDKAHKKLIKGENPADVLAEFSHAFSQKLLHQASLNLRSAAEEGNLLLLQHAEALLGLDTLGSS